MGTLSLRLFSSRSKTFHLFPLNPTPFSLLFSSHPYSSHHASLTSRSATALRLNQGFTPADVAAAIRSQPNPDAASDLFQWAAAQRGYRHTSAAYRAILDISISRHQHARAESLIDEVLAGACPDPDLPLFHAILRFCCSRNHLFSAFDVLKRMVQLGGPCLPTAETYATVLEAVLRRFDRSNSRYVYVRSVRNLVRQMSASRVTPDATVMSLVIKAYSKCMEMDDALKVFDEMSLCGCEPSGLTYGYLVQGMSEKGRMDDGLKLYKEMRRKGFVPTVKVYMALMNGLSLALRFEEAIEVLLDALGNHKTPDLLTYRTLLEGLCREGRRSEAFGLLEELKGRRGALSERTHSYLLEGMHWLCQDPSRI